MNISTPALFGIELPLNVADPFLSQPERFWQARLMPENRWQDIPKIQHNVEIWAERLKTLGVDFACYDLRPHEPEAALTAAQWAKRNDLKLLLNNPYCQINGAIAEGLQTWAYDPDLLLKITQKSDLVGVVYDELLHHQIHNGLEGHTNPWNALADVSETRDSRQAYEQIETGLKKLFDYTNFTNVPAYTEQVVPAFFHAVARSGGLPGVKVLKEQHTPVTTSLCMSAAHQYGTRWMGTIDLWEGDSGPWYQVLARQSGHGVAEFLSALKLMALLNPSLVLLEAADLFWEVDTPEARLTEFGEAIQYFTHELKPKIQPAFDVHSWQPTVAIVHAEDGCWHKGIEGDWRWGRRCGSPHLTIDEINRKWLRVWYHLTWGKVNGSFHIHLTEQQSELQIAEANFISGSEHDMTLHPLEKRRDINRKESHLHNLFIPLNNVAVFDAYVKAPQLATAQLIVLCGSYVLPETLQAVQKAVENGAVCLCQEELAPPEMLDFKGKQFGKGFWWTVADFDTADAVDQFYQYKGFQNQWILKSKLGTLRMYAQDMWGNDLNWELES
jgi:hypothetical protein